MSDRDVTIHLDQRWLGKALMLIAEVLQYLVDNRRRIPQQTIQGKVDELKTIARNVGG